MTPASPPQQLRPKTNERIHANFQTYQTKTAATVYGENHSRLLALKQKHDPENLFHRNSNISPKINSA